MLTCPGCGAENQLGRVFCTSCGAKLDFTNMSSEEVKESQERGWFARHWWKFLVLLIAIVAGLFAVAMWPNSGAIGEAGVRTDGRKVSDLLSTLGRLPKRAGGARSVSDKDINAYFTYFKRPKDLGAQSSVQFAGPAIKVRIIKTAEINLKFTVWTPKVSYDLVCVPQGNKLVVRKAAHGHLPAFGPLKGYVVKQARGVFAAQKEWKGLKNVSTLKFSKGKLYVQYENK